jgi:ESS family glutamate:Na+ symporter
MNQSWQFVLDLVLVSLLIVVAAVLKARIPVLRKLIIPTAMIAGFLGLIAGPEVLGWIDFDPDSLGNLVYHLMAVGFIALSLKEREVKNSPGIVNSGIIIVSTYLIQGIVGLGLMLLLVALFYSDMFPGIGLILPLGFGQGPGQAYSIGSQWEALGLRGGGNLGLTIAGIGFLWATIIGIILMNILVRRPGYKQVEASEEEKKKEPIVEQMEPDEIPLADAIDKLTYQVALIGFIYLITYVTLYAVDKAISPLGSFGETFAQLLFGFHFIIGSIYAIAFRLILNRLQRAGFQLEHAPNNFLLQRIAGSAFDYMITASIAAISIYALAEYAWPVVWLTTIGGIVTIFFLLWIVPRTFPEDRLPNVLGFYGMLTGTISTGLALVKAVDPKFRSNTTENLVVGSASAIAFGFPLMLVLNIPVLGWVNGQPIMYWYTLLLLVGYFAVLVGLLLYRTRRRSRRALAR